MTSAVDEAEAGVALDVLVVGAGQAGLAAGCWLRRTGLSFRLFDPAHRVGDSWRRRYDSLVLFSSRRMNGLPGLPMTGDPEGYPRRDEVADYLERYAEALRLPVSLGESIVSLEREEDRFVAQTGRGRRIASRAVIVAAGAFQRSVVPAFASNLAPEVAQIPADSYRNPGQVPGGAVLVAGGGATGRQIALELARRVAVGGSSGSPVPGLFHVGRSWQTCRASALLRGAGDDAARIVDRVVECLKRR